MRSSGTDAKATNGNDPVLVLDKASSGSDRYVNIVNEGTVRGWVSVDGGVTWLYLPAGEAGKPGGRTIDVSESPINAHVMVKRVEDGSDLSGIYADAY